MRSLYKARHGTVLAVSGLVVVACLLTLPCFFPRPAAAQNPSTPPPPLAEPLAPLPEAPSQVLPPDPAPRSSAPHPQEAFRGMSIDQLVDQVKSLRAQRAELEKREKEAVTVLREKLKDQRQRVQQLGIALEEPAPAAP